MRIFCFVLSFVSFLSAASSAQEQASVTLRAMTLGISGDLAIPVADKLNIRLGIYALKLRHAMVADTIAYDFNASLLNASLLNAGAMMDYHPGDGLFRVSAGAFVSGNKLIGLAQSGQKMQIGDRSYTPAEVGALHSTIKANSIAPYAGIGWGRMTRGKSRINFLVDAGLMFHGTPRAELYSAIPTDSPLIADPVLRAEFDANFDQETAAFHGEFAGFKFYPVVSLGVGFKF